MSKNCPNCGAVYSLEEVKCPFCGTLYYDLTAIDFSEGKPVFLSTRLPNGQVITQCAIPRFESFDVAHDYTDCMDASGMVVRKFVSSTRVTTNVKFEAIPYGNSRTLFTVKEGAN